MAQPGLDLSPILKASQAGFNDRLQAEKLDLEKFNSKISALNTQSVIEARRQEMEKIELDMELAKKKANFQFEGYRLSNKAKTLELQELQNEQKFEVELYDEINSVLKSPWQSNVGVPQQPQSQGVGTQSPQEQIEIEALNNMPAFDITPFEGQKTAYAFQGDKTPDSFSSQGIGAFSQRQGGRKLQKGDVAVSRDVENALRQQGIKEGDAFTVHYEDGSSELAIFYDRTAAGKDSSGKWTGDASKVVPGTELTGRFDFYSPSGRPKDDGKKVVGFSAPQAEPQAQAQSQDNNYNVSEKYKKFENYLNRFSSVQPILAKQGNAGQLMLTRIQRNVREWSNDKDVRSGYGAKKVNLFLGSLRNDMRSQIEEEYSSLISQITSGDYSFGEIDFYLENLTNDIEEMKKLQTRQIARANIPTKSDQRKLDKIFTEISPDDITTVVP